MDDLSRFCCLDPDCALYGRRDAGNLTVCGRFGKQNHIRLLYCRACKYRFSERKGTPLFGSHLPEDKARSVLDHLREGNGTRQTSRLVGVHRDTVTRLAGGPDNMLKLPTTSSWLFPPQTREVQFDEKWAFVAKKQKNCDPANPADVHKGDYWDHVAYDPEHRLVLAVIPGSRSIENAEAIVTEVKQRLGGEPPELITSDEAPAYPTAIENAFGVPVERAPNRPGRPRIRRVALAQGAELRDGA